MHDGLVITLLLVALPVVLAMSVLTYALRDFSRARLELWLTKHHRQRYYPRTVEYADELAFAAAMLRLLANLVIFICILEAFTHTSWAVGLQYLWTFLVSGIVTGLFSIAIPQAIARHAGEAAIGVSVRPLWLMHTVLGPAVHLMRGIDRLVGRAAGPQTHEQEQQAIEEQILSAVEEGEKEGVVDEQEREMIESVIEFRDATVREVMTARPDIVAVESSTGLTIVREVCERTGHSRIPVYEESLDHIIGVIYARDLLKYIGESAETFDMRKAIRQAYFVPETKPLRHLLRDFRALKLHMAIVLDEYGGTAGLVTIEDVLEQLVGEISDEHEPLEPAMIRKIDDRHWEVDARISISELNELLPVNLPEDEEIHTLGGYVATAIGRIPEQGAVLNQAAMRFTVIDAEPQRINRLRIEIIEGPAAPAS